MIRAEDVIADRRWLHVHPEVGLHLPITQQYLIGALSAADIEIELGTSMTSITAIVRGGLREPTERTAVPTLLVRSDMDALPIAEEAEMTWASRNGAMHACGHDCHMAIVLHAALELQRRRDELAGDVVFFFQPGEEGHGGAQLALSEGLLDAFGARPTATLGIHVLAHLLNKGEYASRVGAVLSGSTLVDIIFEGTSGHGSSPQLARNPINAAAEFVGAISSAAYNGIDMFEPAVVTFGSLQAGTVRNVIPDKAVLSGVIRSFSDEIEDQMQTLMRRVAEGIATAHGLSVTVILRRDTVPTMTNPAELEILERAATKLGKSITRLDDPISISEDFSWVLRQVPGVFLLIGARTNSQGALPSNHSSRATFSDEILLESAELVVAWAFERLAMADVVRGFGVETGNRA